MNRSRNIKKFENFDNDMNGIFGFLSDFQSGNFKKMTSKKYIGDKTNISFTYNRTHDIELIKNDKRYNITYDFIKRSYDVGHGIKSIIKDNNLPITYPVLRKLMIDIMSLKLRKYSDITDVLRTKRSDKVKKEHDGGTGWFKDNIIRKQNRGIQGYYLNKSSNKYIWIRSTYEYIYALWLDENNIRWEYEYKSYRLSDGSLYKPDFFVLDKNNNILKIIEVKGFWKNRSYKFDLLKKQLDGDNIELEIISDSEILKFTDEEEKNITKKWKLTRLKELK